MGHFYPFENEQYDEDLFFLRIFFGSVFLHALRAKKKENRQPYGLEARRQKMVPSIRRSISR